MQASKLARKTWYDGMMFGHLHRMASRCGIEEGSLLAGVNLGQGGTVYGLSIGGFACYMHT